MNKMLSLVKTQLNMNFGISALKYRFFKEKKKRLETILIALAILTGVGTILVMYMVMMTAVFAAGLTLNQPEIVLTIAFIASQTLILIFGMFYILGNFYFSHDIETMVPLPLKPYEVIGSKFIVVMVNEYITALPILLPPVIIYGAGMGKGIFYWIKALVLILAAPVIPLTLGAIFVMLLMRVVNLKRNKDLLAIIGGFAGVLLAFGFNFYIQQMSMRGKGQDYIRDFLENRLDLIETIGRRFPPSIWATRGLSESGLYGVSSFVLFVAVSLALFLFLLWLGEKVFYKALLAGQEVSRKKRVISGKEAEQLYRKVSSPVKAIVLREWKLLLRTPVYIINGLTGIIVGPFMLLVVLFAQKAEAETQELMNVLNNPEYAFYVALGGLGVMLFTSCMNLVASTSVSREGKTLWVLKMIPVPPKQQVLAKFLHGFMVSFLGIISTAIIMTLFIRISIGLILVMIVLALLGTVPIVAFNLLIDVFHPKLIWNSEQEAMKQNLNGGLGMLVSVLLLLILGAVTIGMVLLRVPDWAVVAGFALASMVLGAISIALLFAVAEKKYMDYEA